MTRKLSTSKSIGFIALSSALFIGLTPTGALAGKLDKVAKEIRSGSSSASNDNDYDRDSFDSDYYGEYSESVVDIILFPWRLPYKLIDDGRNRNLGFAAYPYSGETDGYLRANDKTTPSFTDQLAFRLRGDASYQIDGLCSTTNPSCCQPQVCRARFENPY